MGLTKLNAVWHIFARNIFIVKILLIIVTRHYLPSHRKALNIYKRLKNLQGPVVTIAHGKLRGKTGTSHNNRLFYSFQGIPYAKPPVGDLRFKAPQPPEPWTEILDASHEGNDCISRHTVLKTMIGSEDCLTINVYTHELPSNKESVLKPVMVWIHGGGFTSGSGSTETYGPEFLMMEDVVLVTFNYRTGIFGFLSLDDPELDVPGNAALKDMLLALKWVQQNIANFSGDPNNVTIFGESAGAASCHYLMLCPKAKGLFHKVILQSGCATNIWAKGQKNTEQLAHLLGTDSSDEKTLLKILQDLPADELLKVSEKLWDKEMPVLACKMRPHGPVVERESDEAVLTEDPLDIIKSGAYIHVPMIIGFTSREGMLGEIVQIPPFRPITDFELSVPYILNLPAGSKLSKELAGEIKQFYYGSEEPTFENIDKYYLLETDNYFLRELLLMLKYHRETSTVPIYLYRMSVETSLNFVKKISNMKEPGVCHADDLGYLFKNFVTPKIDPGSEEDIAIRRFVQFWTNFAKYGDPNPKEYNPIVNVSWKPVLENQMNFLDIGKDLTFGMDPESERMAFWERMLDVYSPNK